MQLKELCLSTLYTDTLKPANCSHRKPFNLKKTGLQQLFVTQNVIFIQGA
jgi:hypothetical protein